MTRRITAFTVLVITLVGVSLFLRKSASPRPHHDVLQQYQDGLNDQANDLGWVTSTADTPAEASTPPFSSENAPVSRSRRSRFDAKLTSVDSTPDEPPMYVAFGKTLKSKLANVVHTLARAKRNWNADEGSGISNEAMTEILKILGTYAPLASDAQEQLSRAVAARSKQVRRNIAIAKSRTPKLQYGIELQDEYNAAAQYGVPLHDQYGAATEASLHFGKKDVPVLSCGPKPSSGPVPEYAPRLDRLDDCVLKPQKTYNRMYSLDRLRAGAPPATPREVHEHMQRVKRFVRKWKPLLAGDGGGDGPGAFDDPYYLCYDQYQEDPEFTQCLQGFAADGAKGPFAVHKWAASDGRGAETHDVMGKEETRIGFPDLDKEWKKTLGPDDSGDWVRLKKDSAVTADGGTWAPLAEDNPAEGEVDAGHVTPFASDALPSPVDGVVGG